MMQSRPITALLGVLALAAPAMPAGAEPVSAILPSAEQAQWNAVGRVNIAGFASRRMCSGVLIAPDRVLTAAHCTLGRGNAPVAPDEIVFVAGWRSGTAASDSIGVAVTRHPGFLRDLAAGRLAVGQDLALITLAAPLEGIAPLPLAPFDSRKVTFEIVAYGADRPHILTRHSGCGVTRAQGAAFGTDCMVVPGSSGAPILSPAEGGWAVVGIVSAGSLGDTLAARVDMWDALGLAGP